MKITLIFIENGRDCLNIFACCIFFLIDVWT